MYYIKTIEDKVRVPPNMLGSEIKDAVLRILRDRFERRIFREVGIVLSADNPELLSDGVVIPGDSGAYYHVKFDALTFLPFVNEIFEAEVKDVVEFGAFASVGPLQGLLHVSQISKDRFMYDKKNKSLISRIEKRTLKKGDKLIVKVSTISIKPTTVDTKIGLTMRPEGLGKIEWLEEKEKKKKEEKKENKKQV